MQYCTVVSKIRKLCLCLGVVAVKSAKGQYASSKKLMDLINCSVVSVLIIINIIYIFLQCRTKKHKPASIT